MERNAYRRTRQLIHYTVPGSYGLFIDTPGYLYHHEPYGVDLFVHHKVIPRSTHEVERGFRMLRRWKVSDPSTGLGLMGFLSTETRDEAITLTLDRLSNISRQQYNTKVWETLQTLPPHKASWRLTTLNKLAEKVDD